MGGPAAHVSVTRSVIEDPSEWRRRAAGVATALALLAVLAWQRSGLVWVGIVLVAVGAVTVLARPSVQSFRNAVSASQAGAWVSGRLASADEHTDRPSALLLMVDDHGMAIVTGGDAAGEQRTVLPWAAVERIELVGPEWRPSRIRIVTPDDTHELTGSLGSGLLEALAEVGVEIAPV